jgi:hypothetical protein
MLIRDHFPAGASGQQLAPSTIMAAPLIEIVRTLADMDALRQVSPEVFSPDNATRSAAKIAALSSASLHALLDAANIAY